jgi:hypothetical protein
MARKNDTIRLIAHSLTQQMPVYARGQGKAIKYPAFKKILTDVLAEHPPHTRLPPVRLLAKSMKISLVTAHRVIAELITDGALYSRPRAGVYIADTTPTPEDTTNSPSFESRFRFGTESRADFQRPLWTDLLQHFGERYPNTQAELTFVSDATASANSLDVYERLDWNNEWSADENQLLDLRAFAPEELAAQCTDLGMLPLYFRSNFLFFNPELLESCAVAEPRFRTFADQVTYLVNNTPLLERCGFNPHPFAVQQPITLVGSSHLDLFFSLVYSDQENAGDLSSLIAAAEHALHLCRLSRRAPGMQNPLAREARQRFMAGREPFFFGHSVDYWEFSQAPLPFSVGCHPTICTDDTLFLHPMVGCVSRHSKRPAESMRLLSYLVSPKAQAQFAETGNYPVSLAAQDAPSTTAAPDWLANVLARSHPMHLPTPERFYLAINVFNNELWHALLDHVSVELAVSQAIHLGRSYLRQHAPSHAIA